MHSYQHVAYKKAIRFWHLFLQTNNWAFYYIMMECLDSLRMLDNCR